MSDGGKGSSQRPLSISHEEFDKNFRGIFGPSKLEKRLQQEVSDSEYDKITRYNQETQEVKKSP